MKLNIIQFLGLIIMGLTLNINTAQAACGVSCVDGGSCTRTCTSDFSGFPSGMNSIMDTYQSDSFQFEFKEIEIMDYRDLETYSGCNQDQQSELDDLETQMDLMDRLIDSNNGELADTYLELDRLLEQFADTLGGYDSTREFLDSFADLGSEGSTYVASTVVCGYQSASCYGPNYSSDYRTSIEVFGRTNNFLRGFGDNSLSDSLTRYKEVLREDLSLRVQKKHLQNKTDLINMACEENK